MYTSKIPGNNTSDLSENSHNIHKFIEGLKIPQLNVEEQESLEKDLTFEELKDALTSLQTINRQEKMDSQKNSMRHF